MVSKTTKRRSVSYSSLEEVLQDAEERAAQKSPTTGNWSQGQIYEHLARTMEKLKEHENKEKAGKTTAAGPEAVAEQAFAGNVGSRKH